ncbi:hypothetical protein RRG08_031255 [Elysia crispata]|uniref:Uncharacterized protein n=1 Tax=Elysia crispata TaxID=231223 RepID=A0AAE1AIM1_9GAST|nr:hypothetical protein RRG08_031255 [Elysia crispata]
MTTKTGKANKPSDRSSAGHASSPASLASRQPAQLEHSSPTDTLQCQNIGLLLQQLELLADNTITLVWHLSGFRGSPLWTNLITELTTGQ